MNYVGSVCMFLINLLKTGFVLLLKLLENYLNIFCKFKGAWKLLKNEKFKKAPWIFYFNTHWMWKKYIGNNKREINIESYLVQERLAKKMCRHYCKQTLRKALFFFVGFPVAKTPKSTGNSATHDSSVHEEHVVVSASLQWMDVEYVKSFCSFWIFGLLKTTNGWKSELIWS